MSYNIEFAMTVSNVTQIKDPDIVVLYEYGDWVVMWHSMLRKNGYEIFRFIPKGEINVTFWKCPEVIATPQLNCILDLLE